ncbi:twin-arginine translocase subunit TatC [Nocardioides yefusunii]|uniref:Sec-independent protein translocase protein TatC n=1 Tax=Nocardioides yefusunii TaxID=2500546 RepID=A0ABW1QT61_9ACTN|nr:twin-arginine translocase subunit TatC [Nocardioides yefusunii]
MPVGDHFRELRGRLLRSFLVFAAIFITSLFFYDPLLNLVMEPYNDARIALGESVETRPYVSGATGPLMLYLKLCGVASLVAASPYWLYQIWAFIVPGLHSKEKKWSRLFAAVAGPLFIFGVLTAYYVLPKGLEVLISFTPDSMESLVEFGEYFSFLSRMLLVFGISFEIPLFVVMLSLAGVVSGKQLGKIRPWLVLGTFIFAAVATPSTDPMSMLSLAIPMTFLFLGAEIVARFIDKVRAKKAIPEYADDEVSAI